MKLRTGAGVVLCLLGWLSVACRFPLPVATGTPAPTATWTPIPTQTPTPTPTPRPTPAPTDTPGPLTDGEAIALMEQELAARGVALNTVRIRIGEAPRQASVRYTSTYKFGRSVFRAQTTLVGLALSQVVLRVQPPLDGGLSVAVLPVGEREVGLYVITISHSSQKRWATGTLSDQDFVGEWLVGTVPKE